MDWKINELYPSDILSCVLRNRNIEDIEDFINPSYEKLVEEYEIPGVKEAKERLIKASARKEKIAIFADYDADGVCGGAILYKALTEYFNDIIVIIPDRSAGYGLNSDAVKKLAKKGINLLITVDCGIRNVKEIKQARTSGIETIVVDHHQLGEELPDAILVHPHLSKTLKFKHFSGGGVAFFLAKSLERKIGNEKWLLDLVAISSIADMVPLIADNRILTKFGLLVLNKTKNAGLRKLLDLAQIKTVGAFEVGYMIAPRLNAAGRISMPQKSFDLLIGSDSKKIVEEAQSLNDLNIKRQDLLKKAQERSIRQVRDEGLDHDNIIILETDFPEGIIGLVSGKITQVFYKPSIVLTRRDGLLKGSARSVPGVNITKLLAKSQDLLESYGGHEQAAGISVKKTKLNSFKKKIASDGAKFPKSLFVKSMIIDAEIKVSDLSLSLAEKLNKLEPYGQGNHKPIFAFKNVRISDLRFLGKGKDHASFRVHQEGKKIKAIAFCFEDKCWKLKTSQLYDLAFTIDIDSWNGRREVKLIIEDVKESV